MKRLLSLLWIGCVPAFADGAADNLAENVRRMPPPGVAIAENSRATLTSETARLAAAIAEAARDLSGKPALLRYLPDVRIFHKAVDWALRYDEFYDAKQTQWAEDQLKEGFSRLESLKKGELPWLAARGLVARGYLSKIDGSVQPFGLVVPESFDKNLPWRWRLDCWFHGRGETLTELDFIHQRQTQTGEFAPADTIVLHPYGRYCNGQRFAGETDFFEALETVKRDYRVDEDRVVVRGFSLGGAACWHIATHYAWEWAAANPGAGFSETEQFLNFFQGEKLQPTAWERKLWNLYDSTVIAGNLLNCPTVAYSGEIDKQKQAADLMAAALKKDGVELTHIIGPNTAHKYEPAAKAEVARRVDALALAGRTTSLNGSWTTATLKYNRFPLGEITALENHWTPATVQWEARPATASGTGLPDRGWNVWLDTTGVAALHVEISKSDAARLPGPVSLVLSYPTNPGSYALQVPITRMSDGSLRGDYVTSDEGVARHWKQGGLPAGGGLRKKHNLQGPIDDAFMDSFIFVRPTGQAANEKAGAWAKREMDRAIEHWRRHFRGDARVKDDTAITEEDIQSANLILWGDAASNSLIAKTAPNLPITWTGTEIKAGARTYPAADHALICIYPNPLNPERYVVLNSGFTFRDYDYLNNARQTPKLPDWAVIDLNTPPNARTPGGIEAADFFGEKWELKP